MASETDTLLPRRSWSGSRDRAEALIGETGPKDIAEGEALRVSVSDASHGESFDAVPTTKRQLGVISAVFLIFNRIVGTGIYATPSLILRLCGSIGMSFVVWLVGSLIAAAGTAVYIELGTGIPRSGGEKNYLEFIYRRPKYLMTCCYAMYALLIAQSAANAVIFGEYTLHALSLPPSQVYTRLVAVLSLTVALILHGTRLRAVGLQIQNALGVFMLAVLLFIAFAGCVAPFLRLGEGGVDGTDGSVGDGFEGIWEGTRFEANAFVMALYNVIWSYIGYSNANYALSEVRDPVRTLKVAAPLAVGSVTVVYLLVNVAYFAVVPLEEIRSGGRIIAALFFRNLFGPETERVVSLIIALSVFGNILAVTFTHGRLVQELGREGVLPYSWWFASNKPFDAPSAGLFVQYIVCCITATAPPPGDAFNFIINLSSYPFAVMNSLIALGLLAMHSGSRWAKHVAWSAPFQTWTIATVFFLISNLFLAIVPLAPPAPGSSVYEHLPYWLHVPIFFIVAAAGGVYWYVWSVVLPKRGGYKLVKKTVLQEDGVSRSVFTKVSKDVYVEEEN